MMSEPTPPHQHDEYLRHLASFSTPDEFKTLLKQLGTVEATLERHAAITEILETNRSRRWVFKWLKDMAAWIVVVGGMFSVLGAGYVTIASLIRALERPANVETQNQLEPRP